MMNYTQLSEQIEQMNGKKTFENFETIRSYFQTEFMENGENIKELNIPCTYAFDMTGEYLERILKEKGYVTGRFCHYALEPFMGCILWNGRKISRKDYIYYVNKAMEQKTDMEKKCLKGAKAYRIELLFLASLFYFMEKKCDYVIIPKEENSDVQMGAGMQKQICLDIALKILSEHRIETDEKIRNKVLKTCITAGHFEVLKKNPTLIIDGADDERSVKILMANLQYHFPDNPYIFIVGCTQEAAEKIVKASAGYPVHIITFMPAQMQNAMSSIELGELFKKLNPNITNAGSVEETLEIAEILAQRTTVITAFGNAAILKYLKNAVSIKAEKPSHHRRKEECDKREFHGCIH